MPNLRHTSLLLLLLSLDLCAQQESNDGQRMVEIFIGHGPQFSSAADSLDFAQFQERNMSSGSLYAVPFRSRSYLMMWHMHCEKDRCTMTRGDGRTLKDFQTHPPPGYSIYKDERTAYSRCVVIEMTDQRPSRQDRWYFEVP